MKLISVFMNWYRPIAQKMKKRRKTIFLCLLGGFVLLFWFSIPRHLFKDPVCWVLLDRNDELLGAKIASDGQWRFPESLNVPDKFAQCIIAFEDKRFKYHPGVDVLALGRAIKQNIWHHRKVSGASTITMQVIRLSKGETHRTVLEKFIEIFQAIRLEISYSKKEILGLYASHAPFGGNIVGLQAASWRYYGKPAAQLSWGETAAIAVLPNSPTLVRPGKNRDALLRKRNSVLDRLLKSGIIDANTCSLAKLEPLPSEPYPLPNIAPHLLEKSCQDYIDKGINGKFISSTIQLGIQQRVNDLVASYHSSYHNNGINNAAVLVLDTRTGEVLAYLGNATQQTTKSNEADVDNVMAPRSTGSILKPLLYCSMLQDGTILPNQLVPDIPTYINSFNPKNFNMEYEGAVPANMALSRSLNIPAVHMLQAYTPSQFLARLQKLGVTTMNKPANYYGLSLILGGAEANLWELAGIYSGLGRTLLHYDEEGVYYSNDIHPPVYVRDIPETIANRKINTPPVLSAASIYLTFEAMLKVSRPDEERYWNNFSSSHKIAWKTGTSFGSRDAWAIGCTPGYVVAVWVGNSNGEGREGLTGIGYAAPVMFDIFNALPLQAGWFAEPVKDLKTEICCKASGYLASDICPDKIPVKVPASSLPGLPCPFHQIVHLDAGGNYQVNSDCESSENMQHAPWFILPPVQEHYYRQVHPEYKLLPPFREDCKKALKPGLTHNMELIYPQAATQIYLPVQIDGTLGSTVFEAAHRNPKSVIKWYIDNQYLGTTQNGVHQLTLKPAAGKHFITLIDDAGEKIDMDFTVITSKEMTKK